MPKVVSSSEAQNNFGAMAQWAEANPEGVIVERRGKPAVAMVSYAVYEELQKLRLQQRKREVFAALERLRERISSRNSDLSEEEIYRLAGFSEEVIAEMIEGEREVSR